MEGRRSTFSKVLADFEARLQGAEFVAIDTELTGVDVEGDPDTFDESAQQRLEKQCRIAERYTVIQIGLTIAGRKGGGRDDELTFASYNIFAFPYVGPELGRDPGFFCQASALQFNAQHRVDFNTWIRDGVSYMNREDERNYLKTSGAKENSPVHEEKVGLLRLWKALCAARLPFVVHCPLDLFFLLAAFERRPLPKEDPKAMAMLIRQCTPKVYDTAHLHGAIGRFKRLGLMKFHEDAKARYDEIASNGNGIPHVKCSLVGDTAVRYADQNELNDELAHEAGFDSLVTAQLFAYLRAISPAVVQEAANRLFLYRSTEYLDLEKAALEGQAGESKFDLNRVTLLVAQLDPADGNDAPRQISCFGHSYKWIDTNFILVVLRASGGAAVRKAAEMAGKVHGVVSWMGFDEWRDAQAALGREGRRHRAAFVGPSEDELSNGLHSNGIEDCLDMGTNRANGFLFGSQLTRRFWPPLGLLAAGAGVLLLAMLARGRTQLAAASGRLLRRWGRS
mmetsp:Transcript_16810/g.29904  ORF Transcript_16810/g.29904 Transcript_16810/m.29904 type:complete len:508 (+) Transcript_16810:152-1675(+)